MLKTNKTNQDLQLLPTVMSVVALLISFMMLCLGHGLLNSLLGIRAVVESFSSFSIGLIGLCYFCGFLVGVFWCNRLLNLVGHIRTFAALGSITSALSISFLLYISVPSWMIFRFLYGICIAALYMVIESWLNAISSTNNRAQVLSIYMVLIYLSFSASQFLLNTGQFDSFNQFIIVSILLSVSIVPLCLSSRARPKEQQNESINFKVLIKKVPYGSISCFSAGLVVGAIWTMMPAFLGLKKIDSNMIPIYIAMTYLGALVFQFPLGKLSDLSSNRRNVIKLISLVGSCVFALTIILMELGINHFSLALLFLLIGGFTFPLYSLSLSHIIDHLEDKHIISGPGALLMLNALGSMSGTLICSSMMNILSISAFLYFCAIVLGLNFMLSFLFKANEPKFAHEAGFVAVPRTTLGLYELDPRIPTDTTKQTNEENT
jgi:MFS family permease